MNDLQTSAAYFLCFIVGYPAVEAQRIVRQANQFQVRHWARMGSHQWRELEHALLVFMFKQERNPPIRFKLLENHQ